MLRIYRQGSSPSGATVLYSNENVREKGQPIIKIWMPRKHGQRINEMPEALAALKRTEDHGFERALLARLRNSITGDYARGFARIEFVDDTWLLRNIVVGSDCACFSIPYRQGTETVRGGKRDIRYSPHNIDDREQAMMVLSVWLMWFNSALSETEFKQPCGGF